MKVGRCPERVRGEQVIVQGDWYYCIHKDLLKLKQDGGWSTVAMCERYAKVMPDAYRQDAIDWLAGKPLAATQGSPAVEGKSDPHRSAG